MKYIKLYESFREQKQEVMDIFQEVVDEFSMEKKSTQSHALADFISDRTMHVGHITYHDMYAHMDDRTRISIRFSQSNLLMLETVIKYIETHLKNRFQNLDLHMDVWKVSEYEVNVFIHQNEMHHIPVK